MDVEANRDPYDLHLFPLILTWRAPAMGWSAIPYRAGVPLAIPLMAPV